LIRDLRKYARQTTTRLIVLGILALFIIGDGLIYLIYGPGAAIGGLLCIGAGLIPMIFFAIADWIVKRANQD
jgi:hypothetical protein